MTVCSENNNREEEWRGTKMKTLSYNLKAIVSPTRNGNLIPGLKFIVFLFAILQFEADLYILNSTKLCQTRRPHSQPMNEFVIMS
jgi:hypothetical protein